MPIRQSVLHDTNTRNGAMRRLSLPPFTPFPRINHAVFVAIKYVRIMSMYINWWWAVLWAIGTWWQVNAEDLKYALPFVKTEGDTSSHVCHVAVKSLAPGARSFADVVVVHLGVDGFAVESEGCADDGEVSDDPGSARTCLSVAVTPEAPTGIAVARWRFACEVTPLLLLTVWLQLQLLKFNFG